MARTKQTDAQFFASQRNWSKAQIKNSISNLKGMKRFCTSTEKHDIDGIIKELERILIHWDDNYESAKRDFLINHTNR